MFCLFHSRLARALRHYCHSRQARRCATAPLCESRSVLWTLRRLWLASVAVRWGGVPHGSVRVAGSHKPMRQAAGVGQLDSRWLQQCCLQIGVLALSAFVLVLSCTSGAGHRVAIGFGAVRCRCPPAQGPGGAAGPDGALRHHLALRSDNDRCVHAGPCHAHDLRCATEAAGILRVALHLCVTRHGCDETPRQHH